MDLPEGLFDLAFYLRRDDFRSKGEVLLEWLDFREAKPDTIEIRKEKSKFIVHDYRAAPNQIEILESLASKTGIIYWAEGVKIDQFNISGRLEVKKIR